MPTDLLIVGAGGHAKVVIEAAQAQNQAIQIVLTDQDPAKEGNKILGTLAVQLLKSWDEFPSRYHCAIGNNQVREQLSIEAQKQGRQPFTITHPNASISPSATLGCGSFVAANAVVAAEAQFYDGCIINHGAVVDHDCQIGAYTHVAPNSVLGGAVSVGSRVLIGSGAVILPGVTIGNDAVVGAGAVVTRDIGSRCCVVGTPAREHDD